VGGGRHGRRRTFTVTEDQLAVVAASVNLMTAYRDLAATDPTMPTYATFRRAMHSLDAGVFAAINRGGGAPALTKTRRDMRVELPHRNDRWVMDSQEIPVRAMANHSELSSKFWQTTALDEATRMVMATVITVDRPNSSDVVACIAAGVQGHTEPDGTFVGGVPMEIAWDNAAEFLSEHVTQMVLTLGILGTAVTPWAPYEKGKIESWHNTVQNELYASLPGFSHGPLSFSGRELWQPGEARELLGEDLLIAKAQLWVQHYNNDRPHSSLAGATPLQAWTADPHPVRRVPDEALYESMLQAEKPRKVSKNGVRFHNVDYVCAELNGHVGREVHIRHLPHDDTFIEVFDSTGHHLGTATPAGRLSPQQRSDLLRSRRSQYLVSRALLDDARALRQRRFEDDVDNGVIVPSNLSTIGRTGGVQTDLRSLNDLLAQARQSIDTPADTEVPPADLGHSAPVDDAPAGHTPRRTRSDTAAGHPHPEGAATGGTEATGGGDAEGAGDDCVADRSPNGAAQTIGLDALSALEDLHRRAQQNQEHHP
jgi:putative transposase